MNVGFLVSVIMIHGHPGFSSGCTHGMAQIFEKLSANTKIALWMRRLIFRSVHKLIGNSQQTNTKTESRLCYKCASQVRYTWPWCILTRCSCIKSPQSQENTYAHPLGAITNPASPGRIQPKVFCFSWAKWKWSFRYENAWYFCKSKHTGWLGYKNHFNRKI